MRTLLMATIQTRPTSNPENAEAEPVVVETGAWHVTLTLDTGEWIVLDRQELALALTDPKQAAA